MQLQIEQKKNYTKNAIFWFGEEIQGWREWVVDSTRYQSNGFNSFLSLHPNQPTPLLYYLTIIIHKVTCSTSA